MDLNRKFESPQLLQSTAIPFADIKIHMGFNKIANNFPNQAFSPTTACFI
jgi:hypothetical protein